MKKNFSAIITAAGQGKRLNSDIPKALMKINKKPLIYWIVKKLNYKVSNLFVIVSAKNEIAIRGYLINTFPSLKNKIFFIRQNKKLGTAHAIYLTRKYIKTKYVVTVWCDQILFTKNTLNKCINSIYKNNKFLVFPSVQMKKPYLKFVKKNNIIKSVQYSIYSRNLIKSGEKDCGIFFFDSKILFKTIESVTLKKLIPAKSKETNLLEILPIYYKKYNKMKIERIKLDNVYESYGINNQKELKRAFKYI